MAVLRRRSTTSKTRAQSKRSKKNKSQTLPRRAMAASSSEIGSSGRIFCRSLRCPRSYIRTGCRNKHEGRKHQRNVVCPIPGCGVTTEEESIAIHRAQHGRMEEPSSVQTQEQVRSDGMTMSLGNTNYALASGLVYHGTGLTMQDRYASQVGRYYNINYTQPDTSHLQSHAGAYYPQPLTAAISALLRTPRTIVSALPQGHRFFVEGGATTNTSHIGEDVQPPSNNIDPNLDWSPEHRARSAFDMTPLIASMQTSASEPQTHADMLELEDPWDPTNAKF